VKQVVHVEETPLTWLLALTATTSRSAVQQSHWRQASLDQVRIYLVSGEHFWEALTAEKVMTFGEAMSQTVARKISSPPALRRSEGQ
jgi:hypothetical protein